MWEHFHHQADIGVRGIGDTLDEAFAEGALALTAVICSPEKVAPREEVRIERQCDDRELLFVDLLNALIYEMAVRNMVFGRFEVHIEGGTLNASAWGEKADPERHETAVEVKAATYTQLKVAQENNKWIAQCVVDV
ncbi:MAG TPA: archease [Anaerohalosphaeraceae bacterium]|mgnify:CR=1 FL=1|jgi:SHS2 domain-containing protein|nr:archease [Anaerohalosphaeraceae bacterium]HRT51159.1 archease [Anaerohalosphaeraceae bacterium]HRT87212.1 archease [Anaerohalosphaeraceae bacterium]